MPKRLTKEEFIARSNKIHKGYFNYDKVTYVNAHTKVTITCPIHGDFEQRPWIHLAQKSKCPACIGNKPLTTEEFINKSNVVHNYKYTYANTVYVASHSSVIITCPTHGDFKQKPYVHLQDHGCPKCSLEIQKASATPTYSYSDWEQAGLASKHFVDFTLYVIECWNAHERFIKIGKTFTHITRRCKDLPYEWKLLYSTIGSANYISTLEQQLHNKHKSISYTPSNTFHGYKECFLFTHKDLILHEFNT